MDEKSKPSYYTRQRYMPQAAILPTPQIRSTYMDEKSKQAYPIPGTGLLTTSQMDYESIDDEEPKATYYTPHIVDESSFHPTGVAVRRALAIVIEAVLICVIYTRFEENFILALQICVPSIVTACAQYNAEKFNTGWTYVRSFRSEERSRDICTDYLGYYRSRAEAAATLRATLEQYEQIRFSFPLLAPFWEPAQRRQEIQRRKALFAQRLACTPAVPHSKRPPLFASGFINVFALLIILWFISPSTAVLERLFRETNNVADIIICVWLYVCVILVFLVCYYQIMLKFAWSRMLLAFILSIRQVCESVDVEKGWDVRRELEWWVNDILTEQTDTLDEAAMRKEITINPILEMISLEKSRKGKAFPGWLSCSHIE